MSIRSKRIILSTISLIAVICLAACSCIRGPTKQQLKEQEELELVNSKDSEELSEELNFISSISLLGYDIEHIKPQSSVDNEKNYYIDNEIQITNLLDRPKEEISAITDKYGVLIEYEDSQEYDYILSLNNSSSIEEIWKIVDELNLHEIILAYPILFHDNSDWYDTDIPIN